MNKWLLTPEEVLNIETSSSPEEFSEILTKAQARKTQEKLFELCHEHGWKPFSMVKRFGCPECMESFNEEVKDEQDKN